MTPREHTASPLREALGELKADARQLVETVQHAALRLKGGRPPRQARARSESALKSRQSPSVEEALQAYERHETLWLADNHTRFEDQIQSIGHPLDQFLGSAARSALRSDGPSSSAQIHLIDATRDWIRRLYMIEQLQRALYSFYVSEVYYRTARLGLELALSPSKVAASEASANRKNREGAEALFQLSDHLTEAFEALMEALTARPAEVPNTPLQDLLGRAATWQDLTDMLDQHKIFDEQRHVIEQQLESLPLPPEEADLLETLYLLIEQLEQLGVQRQSRDRAWHPDEPTRDLHALVARLWLAYTQVTTALVYEVAVGISDPTIDPVSLARGVRDGLLELLGQHMLHGQEVQRRLSIRD